jgi:di/tricarboxylate transporter
LASVATLLPRFRQGKRKAVAPVFLLSHGQPAVQTALAMLDRLVSVSTEYWAVPVFYGLLAVAAAIFARRPATGSLAPGKGSVRIVTGWTLVLVLPPLLYLTALAGNFSVEAALFTAILGATILMWMFALVDEFVPVLFAVVSTLFIGLAPSSVALGGFSSTKLLLLIGVFALSAVMTMSALSQRVMLRALLRLPDRPFWHQVCMLAGGYLLSPVMPSANARVALLLPVFKDMAGGLRLPARGTAITALAAATFAGGVLFSPMMATSKSANIAALGFLPQQMQAEFSGLFWLWAALAAALTVTVLHLLAMPRLFPVRDQPPMSKETLRVQLEAMGPVKPSEKVAAGGFLFFLAGCATVSWHHISPALLGGCVLLLLLVTGTLLRKDFQRQVDWPMLLFLLGIDCITRIMGYLEIDKALAAGASDLFGFVGGSASLFILAALATSVVLRFFLPTTPSMLTTAIILLPVAAANGIHPWVCIFLAALFSDVWFLRYQGTNGYLQICAAEEADRFDERGLMRYNHWMNLARVAAAFASVPWWQWLDLL